jgi:hypothetical protein
LQPLPGCRSHPYSKDAGNAGEAAAKAILESRGNAPRLYRNALVFLAVDKTRLQDLDEAVRRYLAWESILTEKDTLDLSPHQVKQAETQRGIADGAVTARIPEAYKLLILKTRRDVRVVEGARLESEAREEHRGTRSDLNAHALNELAAWKYLSV